MYTSHRGEESTRNGPARWHQSRCLSGSTAAQNRSTSASDPNSSSSSSRDSGAPTYPPRSSAPRRAPAPAPAPARAPTVRTHSCSSRTACPLPPNRASTAHRARTASATARPPRRPARRGPAGLRPAGPRTAEAAIAECPRPPVLRLCDDGAVGLPGKPARRQRGEGVKVCSSEFPPLACGTFPSLTA